VTFDVSGLKKAVVVVAGDRVLVQARIGKDDVSPLKARKLNKLDVEETETETEAPAARMSERKCGRAAAIVQCAWHECHRSDVLESIDHEARSTAKRSMAMDRAGRSSRDR
jgi:hypothetical protein